MLNVYMIIIIIIIIIRLTSCLVLSTLAWVRTCQTISHEMINLKVSVRPTIRLYTTASLDFNWSIGPRPIFYCRMPFLSQTVSSFALSNAWRNMVSLRARHHWAMNEDWQLIPNSKSSIYKDLCPMALFISGTTSTLAVDDLRFTIGVWWCHRSCR